MPSSPVVTRRRSTATDMETVATTLDLQQQLHLLRSNSGRIAFVPTMGNLHAGHLRLVKHARAVAHHVVVSIFVNPAQFGSGEDFDGYPRTLQDDTAILRANDVSVLFTPDEAVIYPGGRDAMTSVSVPGINSILEGAHRPTHFDGVSNVVARLFNLVQPDIAVFGEKDFQQLLVIRRMVEDLCMPIRIDAVETAREADGLAMSSRNSYLDADQRARAGQLYQTLLDVATLVGQGERDYAGLSAAAASQLDEAGFRTDYVSIRRAADLADAGADDTRLRILAAAHLGSTRLIDNIGISTD